VSLHQNWVLQIKKQHPFLIHAGTVYTICVLYILFLSSHARLKAFVIQLIVSLICFQLVDSSR